MPRTQQKRRDTLNNLGTCITTVKRVLLASPAKYYNRTSPIVRPRFEEQSEEILKVLLKSRNLYDKDIWNCHNLHCLTQKQKKEASKFLYRKVGLKRTMGVYQARKMTDKLLNLHAYVSDFKFEIVSKDELEKSKKYFLNEHLLDSNSFAIDRDIIFNKKKIQESFKGDKYFKIGKISPFIRNSQFDDCMNLKGQQCLALCVSFFGAIKNSFHYSALVVVSKVNYFFFQKKEENYKNFLYILQIS
eukprot:TRINITY_DN941_c0_g1_i13.p1 TRINITY_DN941_c0_g1~~TRINITY_DN941_c0_g1_i13.p1  ORF type:complete len:245 (+),score=42.67 TRINITY_DN941_c0_g1_i13:383-1117(+)